MLVIEDDFLKIKMGSFDPKYGIAKGKSFRFSVKTSIFWCV